MFLVLVALILRPVGVQVPRQGRQIRRWRGVWDWALFVGGLVPALIFGVAFGNRASGRAVPFRRRLRAIYTGGFFGLLNPFALLCGLVSVMMLATHGAVYLHMKTAGDIAARARRAGIATSLLTLILFAAAGLWIYAGIKGYALSQPMDHAGPSTLVRKTVEITAGAWLDNYHAQPWTAAAPLLGLIGPLLTALLLLARRPLSAFLASALGLVGIIATPGLAMFPFILPSSAAPNASLTVWDASASQLTLFIMLVAVVIFLPIVLAYTAWVYRILHGKITPELFETNRQAY